MTFRGVINLISGALEHLGLCKYFSWLFAYGEINNILEPELMRIRYIRYFLSLFQGCSIYLSRQGEIFLWTS